MSHHPTAADPRHFETAQIRTHCKPTETVTRRRAAVILSELDAPARHAVEIYQSTVETVLAGGSRSTDPGFERVNSGISRIGRQHGTLVQIEFLKKMENAIGNGNLPFTSKACPNVSELALWRALVLGGSNLRKFLKNNGMNPTKMRCKTCRESFFRTADRVALEIGRSRNIVKGEKMS